MVQSDRTWEQKIFDVGDLGCIQIQVDLRWLDLPDEAAEQLRLIVHHYLPQVVTAARRAKTADSPQPSPNHVVDTSEVGLADDQRPHTPRQRDSAHSA